MNSYQPTYEELLKKVNEQEKLISELKAERNSLNNSLFETLFVDNYSVMLIVDSENGKIVNANKSACNFYGYSFNEITRLGIKDIDIIEEELIQPNMQKAINEIQNHFNFKHKTKNGDIKDVDVYVGNLFINGKHYLVSVIHDITERKKIEEENIYTKERFKALHDATSSGIAIHENGIIIDCNYGLSEMSGYTESELIGADGVALLIAPESHTLVMNNIIAEFETPYEAFGLRKNGERYPLLIQGKKIFYKGKYVRSTEFRDLSEIKNIERKLRESKALYQSLFENSKDGVVIIDTETAGFIKFNNQVCKQLGYSREEFAKLRVFDIEAFETTDQTISHIKKILLKGKDEFETRQKTKQGEVIDVFVMAQVLNVNEKLIYHCIWRDITKNKKYEQELIKAKEEAEESERYSNNLNFELKHITEELRLSNFKLEKINKDLSSFTDILQNSLNEIFFFNSQTLKFIYANKGALKNLGYTLGEIRNLTPIDIKPEISEEEFFRIIEPLKNDLTEFVFFETVHQRKDFSVYPVYVTIQKSYYENSEVFVAIILDITDKKQKEMELKLAKEKAEESERKIRSMIKNTEIGILYCDIEGEILEANPIIIKILGFYSLVETLKTNLLNFKPLKDIGFAEDFAICIREKRVLSTEGVYMGRRGDSRFLKYYLVPIIVNNHVVGIWVNFHDLTGLWIIQKELEESKKKAEENEYRWKFALEGSGDGVWDWNLETNKVYFSPQWKSMLGFSGNELSGHLDEWKKMIHPDDFDKVGNELNKYLSNETKIYSHTHRLLCKDGTYKWILDRGMIVERNEQNKPIRMIGTHTDLTEQIEMENKLRQANADKDKFFSIIAHDLRSPFQGLLGISEILVDNKNELSTEETIVLIGQLSNSTKKLYDLLENLLQWSRLKRGMIKPVFTSLPLLHLINEIVGLLDSNLEVKKQSIIVDIPSDIIVNVDFSMFNSTIRNLLTNAIKFSYIGGKIYIIAKETQAGIIQISIKDYGIGIKEEDLSKLFKIDSKISKKGTLDEPSTGLGLILCKEYIEHMGGKIRATSQEDEGTVFTIEVKKGF